MRSLFMVIAFALAGVAAVLSAMLMVSRIEATSVRELDALLQRDGLDWVEARVDGLRVTLEGTAPDEGTRFRAVTLAGQVVDATHVIDAMDVAPSNPLKAPEFKLEILRNDQGVSLIGLAPVALDRAELAELIDGLASDGEVMDLLQTADYPVPAGWQPALDFALGALEDLPRSKISVAPGAVSVTAISESAQQKRELEQRLRRAVPEGVTLEMDISAPRPVITPFTLRYLLDANGGRFDACSAHREEGREKILAAARAAGLTGDATCRIGLGVPSPNWPDAVSAALAALAQIGGGSLTFSDADVTLIAAEGTDQRAFDRVVGELESALPDVFSLRAVLPEPEQTGEENPAPVDLKPEFSAELTEEGGLNLRGRVNGERQRDAVESFARGRFSSAEVVPAMRVAQGLPGGWAGRVFAGLEALTYVEHGALTVTPDHVVVAGMTHDPDATDEISRILGAALEGQGTFDIDVEFVEIIVPEVILPSPRECVDTINAILTDKKITFEPGSADIDRDARGTIDRIADVMRDCAAVPMEIAGHTDSQGRESMNLGLSQRRAEAVLESLMARRVLVANLTAKGYGEAIPIADNDTEEGREANRRIEFTLVHSGNGAEEGAAAEDEDAAAEDENTAEVAEEAPDEDSDAAEESVDEGSGDGEPGAEEAEPETDGEAVETDGSGDDTATDENAEPDVEPAGDEDAVADGEAVVEPDTENGEATDEEAAPETDSEPVAEEVDTVTETEPDTASEEGAPADTETSDDDNAAEPDAEPEAGAEPEGEAASEGEADAETDADPEAEAEPETETETDVTSEADDGPAGADEPVATESDAVTEETPEATEPETEEGDEPVTGTVVAPPNDGDPPPLPEGRIPIPRPDFNAEDSN